MAAIAGLVAAACGGDAAPTDVTPEPADDALPSAADGSAEDAFPPFKRCGRDEDCVGSAAGPRCDLILRECIPCLTSADCEGEGSRCVAMACVAPTQCATASDCPVGRDCLKESGVCTDCELDQDCEPAEVCHRRQCKPRCNVLACRVDGLVCNDEAPTCVECNVDSDCALRPDRSRCDVATHTCTCPVRFTGDDCTSCATGWQGARCDTCAPGWFGPSCESQEATEGFVAVEPGSFEMGSPDDEFYRGRDELLHEVTLTQAFWLQTTEVTQRQWQAVMGTNPSQFKAFGPDHPVENVSWEDAVAYLNRLSDMEGRERCYEGSDFVGLQCSGYRLPTEAEWEYAARAEIPEARYGDLDAIAWHRGNAEGRPQPVGGLEANPWGFHDMLGNVWEWVQDWHGDYADGESDPTGPPDGTHRVARGGSWILDAGGIRAARRGRYMPNYRYGTLGFRAARSQVEPDDDPEDDPELP
jgi:formylglycine-generating enzyme required for sulfatase activity